MTTVRLEEWEYENAVYVAQNRHAQNRDVPDSPDYDTDRMGDNLQAEIAACCAEVATAKLLGKYWVAGHWPRKDHDKYRHFPDVSPNIEVKRIREPNHNLLAKQRYVGQDIVYVCAHPHADDFRTVDVIGWMTADEAWEQGEPVHWDKTGTIRLVRQEKLNPL